MLVIGPTGGLTYDALPGTVRGVRPQREMGMFIATGIGMILTSIMLTGYSWATGCQTCFAAEDGAMGGVLIGGGVVFVLIGGPVERLWGRLTQRRYEVEP